jgi:hypothetical protein
MIEVLFRFEHVAGNELIQESGKAEITYHFKEGRHYHIRSGAEVKMGAGWHRYKWVNLENRTPDIRRIGKIAMRTIASAGLNWLLEGRVYDIRWAPTIIEVDAIPAYRAKARSSAIDSKACRLAVELIHRTDRVALGLAAACSIRDSHRNGHGLRQYLHCALVGACASMALRQALAGSGEQAAGELRDAICKAVGEQGLGGLLTSGMLAWQDQHMESSYRAGVRPERAVGEAVWMVAIHQQAARAVTRQELDGMEPRITETGRIALEITQHLCG